ncbi:MAG: hypothetical protein LBR79_03535 [Oscillospiraceae bacterium]|nr:hypothetical protein [Oscillospiraceae bacterium]
MVIFFPPAVGGRKSKKVAVLKGFYYIRGIIIYVLPRLGGGKNKKVAVLKDFYYIRLTKIFLPQIFLLS